LTHWPEGGPPLLWRVEGFGEGIAAVAISDGRVFTLGYRDELEYVTAVSAKSGEQLWMTPIGPAVAENRLMRWLGQRTPTVDDERLYAVRSDGDLVCLRVDDGRELWRRSYVKEFGTKQHGFGICDYPLVDGERLICVPGGRDGMIVALNKQNGEVVWKTSVLGLETSRTWAATVVTEGGGIRQYVIYLHRALVGVAADDGRLLWQYERIAQGVANSLTPMVRDDLIFAYNGYATGRALLRLVPKGRNVDIMEEYFHRGTLTPFQDSTVLVGDCVHALRGSTLQCFDVRTGEEIVAARTGTPYASMTYADEHLIVRSSDGVVSLIKATSEGYLEKSSFTIPDHEPGMGATNPIVAGGRLWLRDDNYLFCYDLRGTANDGSTLAHLITLTPDNTKHRGASQPVVPPRSVFVPTPLDVVLRMLELAEVKETDVVYDLGSGDGRIVIAAAKQFGCKGVGYEIDRELVEFSQVRAKGAGVASIVTIEHRDIFDADLSEADVITVYLLPRQLEALIPQFATLKPHARIVSHQFEIPNVGPDKTVEMDSKEDGNKHTLYLWTTPFSTHAKASGRK